MSQPTWREKLRYRFDSFMSKGGSSIFASLVIVFLALFAVLMLARTVAYFVWGDEGPLSRQAYIAFLQLTDPSGMEQDIDTPNLVYRIAAIVGGLAGVIIFSMLIAFITTALDQRLQELKKGHSRVIETGHTLILGWNDRVPEILRELIIANEDDRNACVVILAEKDKEEMDDYLKLNLRRRKTTRVVTRSGAISSLVNLEIASVATCRSVIVLANATDADPPSEKAASDFRVIKTILGVMAVKPDGKRLNVVAELFDERHRQTAEGIAPGEVTSIDADQVLARLLVQTSRSTGLSVVYGEMLSFAGAELYSRGFPWPAGLTFGQAQFHFPDGVAMGIARGAEVLFNPPPGEPLRPGDQILILAEDDSSIKFRSRPVVKPRELPLKEGRLSKAVEHDLVIGWNPKAVPLIREYNGYVLPGSSVRVLMANPTEPVVAKVRELNDALPNLEVSLTRLDPMDPDALERVEPWNFQNIVILSQGGRNSDPETVDSQSIVILLLLRKIFAKHSRPLAGMKIISEVMDSRNQELIARSGVNDFIISNRLISMLMAQMSEAANIKLVYENLFAEGGAELYIKPASLYLEAFPAEAAFADLMLLAQQRQEVCVGVKIQAEERQFQKNYGIKLNPGKKTAFRLQPGDGLIVLAENET